MADYLFPAGMTSTMAAAAISSRLEVRRGRVVVSERTYYDTFDGLLAAGGMMGIWEEGWLALVTRDSDRVRAREQLPKPPRPLLARDLPSGLLAQSLSKLIDVRALMPLVEVRLREQPLDVLNRDRKTVVRVRIQQPVAERRRLPERLHVVAVRGYEKAYKRVIDALAGFAPAPPLVDEALLASGRSPGGTRTAVDVCHDPGQRTADSAALVLRTLLDVIETNMDGAIADLDSEFLHDLRIAVRRTRAVQRELRAAFPQDQLARFRTEFRWLQAVTGEARDLDVYVLDFEKLQALVPERARPDLEPLLSVLRHRRRLARRRMTRALRSRRTRVLIDDWKHFLEDLPELPADDRPAAGRPIGQVSAARIAKVYRRMVEMGEAVGPLTPPEHYHELRKQGKELRYLLELFGNPLHSRDVVRPMVKALKALQDVLGRHQDREIQVGTLRSLGPEVAAASGGAAAVMAMGMLVERLEADQLAAREEFAGRFAAFAAPQQRRLVKDTFR